MVINSSMLNSQKTLFLKTLAQLIIATIRLDSNKDGNIKTTEVLQLVTSAIALVPFLASQFSDFKVFIQAIKVETIAQELKDFASMQLLPDEFTELEAKVDTITLACAKIIEGVFDIVEAVKTK